ncbi:hypothetical protein G7054_g8378 [Neopestalotiopsis clavispora]|nr:hypothetical protein G7054_g8378 [Neopestalotiopsis clavispora]
MRLLRSTHDGFSLTKDLPQDDIPSYAILSHTWGSDDDEVTYRDMSDRTGMTKPGYHKLKFCSNQASRDGLEYFWIDTCCIDKSNSAELTEALNSMYRWYQNAARCYVFLSDVSSPMPGPPDILPSTFWRSRWFTRGWTLQELIAPPQVDFYSLESQWLGNKISLRQPIHEITAIPFDALQGRMVTEFTVNERRLWAANRTTKREEDMAYCLLGIFGVFLPLIYGEGKEYALLRLEEEIERRCSSNHDQANEDTSPDNCLLPHSTEHGSKERLLGDLAKPSQENVQNEISATDSVASHTLATHIHAKLLHSVESPQNLENTRKTRQRLLGMLRFPEIDDRLINLKEPAGDTCQWFLLKPEYISWQSSQRLSQHPKFLWIRGKPATGKSILMKFLYFEAKKEKSINHDSLVIPFFFNARGSELERSVLGCYRSLLVELFVKFPDTLNVLDQLGNNAVASVVRSGWQLEPLKKILKLIIFRLKDIPILLFIDALDECAQDEVAEMVYFFEELCSRNTARLHICLSSRHYPNIMASYGDEITLENEIEHQKDLESYIESNARLRGYSKAAALKIDLLRKSSGIFLWVALVLQILNKEFANGRTADLRQRLQDIPPSLHELFEMILTRDNENLEDLEYCVSIILLAKRPLSPEELYFAHQQTRVTTEMVTWNRSDISPEDIRRFISSCSKGLVEIVKSQNETVQFIHESVRNFIVGRRTIPTSRSSSKAGVHSHGHELMRDLCMRRIMSVSDSVPDSEKPLGAISAQKAQNDVPFLTYATDHIFHHANCAQGEGASQVEFIAEFPFLFWIELSNLFRQPWHIRTTRAHPLYLFAEENLQHLLAVHPELHLQCRLEGERYGFPILAAAAKQNEEAFKVLLQALSTRPISDADSRQILNKFHHGTEFLYQHGESLLFYLLDFDWKPAVEGYLQALRTNQSPALTGVSGFDILTSQKALKHIELLLAGGVDPNSRNSKGETPISHSESTYMTEILIKHGADTEIKDYNGNSPLSIATKRGHSGVVEILLASGLVDLDSANSDGWTPLLLAAKYRHSGIMKMLVSTDKVDLERKDPVGRTALSHACEYFGKDVIALLGAKTAELDSADNIGRTPLSYAAGAGNRVAASFLVSQSHVDLDSKDHQGRTPLSHAAGNCNIAVVRLLLETGKTDPDSVDVRGLSPLHHAVNLGQEYHDHDARLAIIRALLMTGKVNVRRCSSSGHSVLDLSRNLLQSKKQERRELKRMGDESSRSDNSDDESWNDERLRPDGPEGSWAPVPRNHPHPVTRNILNRYSYDAHGNLEQEVIDLLEAHTSD